MNRRFRIYYLATAVLILFSITFLSACGGQSTTSIAGKTTAATSTVKAATASKPAKTPGPSILIMSPESGYISTNGDVTITVKVLNLNLADKPGQSNAAGEGHVVFYLDVDIPKTPGAQGTTASGTCAATSATTYTWRGLKAGHHMLRVQLVNNDNTTLTDPVFASVGIDVK
jgi:hypothetical protein